jgi:glycosyltransferase involved in cell wall biosynthesis
MKIALIAPTYLPARRANTIQVMKMAQAFAALGHDLLVLVPGKKGEQPPVWETLAHHYGLLRRFEIEWLPSNPRWRSYDYAIKAILRTRTWGADLIYTRLPQAAAFASFLGIPSIYEIHDVPQGTLGPWLLTRFLKGGGAQALVVITMALKAVLISQYSLPEALPLIVAPDGVDLARYQNLPPPLVARQSLRPENDLRNSDFIAGYTGHLYPGRGMGLILEIAAQLPEVVFLLVGGEPQDVDRVRTEAQTRGLENIILTGFVPNADLPLYQAACDILLMPYQKQVSASSGGDIAEYLSPMKLFEYLASGRMIISSNLPVLQEVLNAGNAVLLSPNNAADWVAALQDLRTNTKKRTQLAAQAKSDAQKYSWEKRVENILSLLANS